ncbi:MAG TPA: hypothetical protein PLT92_09175 [Ignavibacteriaceae bacterium]|jgi:ATP-dependent DNA helicase RecG|nr:hypothetical protein [Ignavibacteriaceae bacterium]HOJ18718.1 hypothetical protein [Ignavibacteriaceae bacterium]HPO56909.1 hypothetical protein [Ignavibacteriaceae bacterium]
MSRSELQEILSVKNTKYFRESYLKPAMEDGIIEMTIPERRNNKNQKYRLLKEDLK